MLDFKKFWDECEIYFYECENNLDECEIWWMNIDLDECENQTGIEHNSDLQAFFGQSPVQ